jgi:hypothetical protein
VGKTKGKECELSESEGDEKDEKKETHLAWIPRIWRAFSRA